MNTGIDSPEILRVFQGREDVLCAKLQKKYGCHPDILKKKEYDPTYKSYAIPRSRGGALDYRSEEFQPLYALQHTRELFLEGMQVSLEPFDNLHKCRVLVRSNNI